MPRNGGLFGSSKLILFIAVILEANPPPVCSPPCLYYSNWTAIGAIEYLTGTRSTVVPTAGLAIALDVDVDDNLLFWSDAVLHSISRINLTDGRIDKIVEDRLGVVDGLAVEWYSNFLYWTDSSYDRVEMARIDGTERRILFSTGVDNPRGIAVDPRYGYMFWTDWGSQPKIERATLSGQGRSTIIDSTMINMYWPNDIVIDFSRDIIYWVDAKIDIIGIADFDGNNRNILSFTQDIHPFSIAIYPPVLFWSDWHSAGTIRRINKELLVYLSQYDNLGTNKVMGIAMFDESRQPAGTFTTCSSTKGSTTPLILETSVPILFTSTHALKSTVTTPNFKPLYSSSPDHPIATSIAPVAISTAILLARSSAVKFVTEPSSKGPTDRHSTTPPSAATTLPPNTVCSSRPCQNGTCIPLDDGTQFRCDCNEGFGLERCSVFIGNNAVHVTIDMALHEWDEGHFKASIAKALKEYCEENDCRHFEDANDQTHLRERSNGDATFQPEDVIIVLPPNKVQELLLVGFAVVDLQSTETGSRAIPADFIYRFIEQKAKDIGRYLGDHEVRIPGTNPTRGDVSMLSNTTPRTGQSSGKTAGATVGGVIGLGCVIIMGVWFWRHRNRAPDVVAQNDTQTFGPEQTTVSQSNENPIFYHEVNEEALRRHDLGNYAGHDPQPNVSTSNTVYVPATVGQRANYQQLNPHIQHEYQELNAFNLVTDRLRNRESNS